MPFKRVQHSIIIPTGPPAGKPSATLEFSGKGDMDGEVTIFAEFKRVSEEHSAEIVRGGFRQMSTYADHWGFISAVASAVPLAVLIKSAKDILIKWIDTTHRPISVNLDGKKKILVSNVAELDEVLRILSRSDFASNPGRDLSQQIVAEAEPSSGEIDDKSPTNKKKKKAKKPKDE